MVPVVLAARGATVLLGVLGVQVGLVALVFLEELRAIRVGGILAPKLRAGTRSAIHCFARILRHRVGPRSRASPRAHRLPLGVKEILT